MLEGSYNHVLVACSCLVAFMASYTALNMVGRIGSAIGSSACLWLMGGGIAMGAGIWSMHFVGMLAFTLPISTGYDLSLTLLSLVMAVVVSTFALWLVSQKVLSLLYLLVGAIPLGVGIACMHYMGMYAMHMMPPIEYTPSLFVLSILISGLASGAALFISFKLRERLPGMRVHRLIAAVVMGGAIVSMHYSGMAAANFPVGSQCGAALSGISTQWLALLVVVIALAILGLALLASMLDIRMESRAEAWARSLELANQELKHQALHDHLTSLPNRALLSDRLEYTIQVSARTGGKFALMYIDLDGFKMVNDMNGHHIGDRLLVEVSKRIKSSVRACDTLARLGGDEFVLIADIENTEDAEVIAKKIGAAIRTPFVIGNLEMCVSTSIGIAVFPEHGLAHFELARNADSAMYYAKSTGRDAYSFYSPNVGASNHEKLQLQQDVRWAAERGQLVLHYQAKFRAPGGPAIGAEALVRWQHPTYGLIPPDKFISLAEKVGAIYSIGEWVLDQACHQLRQWHDSGKVDWTMAVNISPLQFTDANLVALVKDVIERNGVEPRFIVLEVTETTAMQNIDLSISVLNELARVGVKIAVDDFGTGHSSLLYLKKLPVSELKIDRGFVKDLSQNLDDTAILSTIIALGRALGLSVVAEGVETEQQQMFLSGLGCSSLQGYLLGKPMPAREFYAANSGSEQRSESKN